jgi:hypothetical protein
VEKSSRDFFWPSYVDLLTALFAVILVLFVLSFKMFKDQTEKNDEQKRELKQKNDSLKVIASQAERIRKIDQQIAALEKKGTFVYDNRYKRFLVKDFIGKEIFEEESFVIKEEFKMPALMAGKEISDLINSFRNEDISFLVLIEGNTAKYENGGIRGTVDGNYRLSFMRSLALANFWKENAVSFGDNTELIISGSGVYGMDRDNVEANNKRFLIQVIPKIKK